jgi:hypothetical protein
MGLDCFEVEVLTARTVSLKVLWTLVYSFVAEVNVIAVILVLALATV